MLGIELGAGRGTVAGSQRLEFGPRRLMISDNHLGSLLDGAAVGLLECQLRGLQLELVAGSRLVEEADFRDAERGERLLAGGAAASRGGP